jgi:hypothetical protein
MYKQIAMAMQYTNSIIPVNHLQSLWMKWHQLLCLHFEPPPSADNPSHLQCDSDHQPYEILWMWAARWNKHKWSLIVDLVKCPRERN